MTIQLVVAVTDYEWFQFLSLQPGLDEVNFWSPSGTNFQALQPGEFFLFKLHSPRNFLVGGGVFAYANTLPTSVAWAAFGEKNGAPTLSDMRKRIAMYRHIDPRDPTDFEIGNRILTQPFFLPESQWMAVPASWSKNIVSFKTYSTDDLDGLRLWEAAQRWLDSTLAVGFAENQTRYGEPTLMRPRLGQGAFRVLVTDTYRRRCAITQERTLPALDAAHIVPFSEGGNHEASNGMLLRRDIHGLFDAGYATITPAMRFEVSPRIREDYENGRDYYKLNGLQIQVPDRLDDRPDRAALQWHNEEKFLT